MGSGKSSVGRHLAEALNYRFIDADTSLEQVAGRPIPEIFASDGESGFRALESAVLNQIASWHSLVVATGGGVVTQPANWGELHQGVVVWLDAPDAMLLQRLQADPTPRPLMEAEDRAERLRPCWPSAARSMPRPTCGSFRTAGRAGGRANPRGPAAIIKERAAPPGATASHQRRRRGGPIDQLAVPGGSSRIANHCTVTPGCSSSSQAVSSNRWA